MSKFEKLTSFLIFILILLILQACSTDDLGDTKIFDISQKPEPFFLEKTARDKTVMQSIAFDNLNEHMYVLQVMGGNQTVGDETVAHSWNTRSEQGDLTLTQMDYEGNQIGHMHLKGFGHGVSMGVEIEDEEPYIWLETDAVTEGDVGWGKKLARILFEDRTVLDAKEDDLETYELIEGVDRTTVNIDQAHDMLTMRYRKEGDFYFSVFSLSKIKEESYEPLYTFPQPEEIGTFQGFASHGSYLYLLEGGPTLEGEGDTYVYSIDLEKEEVFDKQFIDVAMDLPYREPEGMAISLPDHNNPNEALLHFGFASEHKDYQMKMVNIYSFDEMILPEK